MAPFAKRKYIYTVLGIGRHSESGDLMVACTCDEEGLTIVPLNRWAKCFTEIKAGELRGASQPIFRNG